jgi:hypothetical protein
MRRRSCGSGTTHRAGGEEGAAGLCLGWLVQCCVYVTCRLLFCWLCTGDGRMAGHGALLEVIPAQNMPCFAQFVEWRDGSCQQDREQVLLF